jgi:hypothetical protein
MNSNDLGYEVVEGYDFTDGNRECHFSIPYPHKYASLVNDAGMFALLVMVLKRVKFTDIWYLLKFLVSLNVTNLLPVLVRMEIPKNLPKGSTVYLQNIITDMIMGLSQGEMILNAYINCIKSMGYRPGFITLNLNHLYHKLSEINYSENIYICFNFNASGFNVFPSVEAVQSGIDKIKKTTNWKLMAMSVFSSGAASINIEESIRFIKNHDLDYVVFGSSRLTNIESNLDLFHEKDN